MNLTDIENILSNPNVQPLVLSFVYSILVFLTKLIFKYIQSLGKGLNKKNINTISIFLYVGYLALIGGLYFYKKINLEVALLSVIIVSIIHIIILYRYIYKLRKIGIVSTDLHIKNGLDYIQTIKATKTNFQFLGVGARKLTLNKPDFEKMIERVNQNGNRVQLLLCHPSSDALTYLAKRAEESPDDYTHKVSSSLKYMAKLVTDKDYGIDIRFYHAKQVHDMPIFRIVLLNSSYCLTSYTQFNDSSHEGQLMPQIHFVRNSNEETNNSFYFAFETHFERLWLQNKANEWNPKEIHAND